MNVDSALNLLIIVLVGGLIVYLLWWLIDYLEVPAPFNKVAKGIIAIVAVVFLIKVLLGLINGGGFSLTMLTMKVLT
jgi:hypothetical protein